MPLKGASILCSACVRAAGYKPRQDFLQKTLISPVSIVAQVTFGLQVQLWFGYDYSGPPSKAPPRLHPTVEASKYLWLRF